MHSKTLAESKDVPSCLQAVVSDAPVHVMYEEKPFEAVPVNGLLLARFTVYPES